MSTLTVDTIDTKNLGDLSVDDLKLSLSTAWVSFIGTSVSILEAYNVQSVTDYFVGRYEITYSKPLSSTNYLGIAGGYLGASTAGTGIVHATTVTGCRMSSWDSSTDQKVDAPNAGITIFGGQ